MNFVKKTFLETVGKGCIKFQTSIGLKTVFLLQSLTGEDRVILTWAEQPPDLDMHLFICNKGCEVFWHSKNCENVNLDVDDTTGNGPETMTLASQMPAPLDQTYVLWVCIFQIQVLSKSFTRKKQCFFYN